MTSFNETKILPYTSKQVFDLVVDIESYPQFLPWCKIAKITEIVDKKNLKADLVVNFKNFFEKYTSLVTHEQVSDNQFYINAVAIEGPFKALITKWHLKNINNQNCQVDFFIDFSFNSIILEKVMSSFFKKAAEKMVNAFEKRARDLYKTNNQTL